MSTAAAIQEQLAEASRGYQTQLGDLAAQDQRIRAKFGTNSAGQLDFINPADPFSITGSLKRLFREQNDAQKYGAAAQGGLFDGATSEEAGKLGVRHQQQQRDVTDEYNEAIGGVQSQRVGVEGNYRAASASLQADLARAFAEDQAATLAAAQAAAPAAGEAGAPGAAAKAPTQTKVARGFVWALNSNGTWRKLRPVNAFGH